jgi:hypothetical protein
MVAHIVTAVRKRRMMWPHEKLEQYGSGGHLFRYRRLGHDSFVL